MRKLFTALAEIYYRGRLNRPLKYAKWHPIRDAIFYFHIGKILLREIHLFHLKGLAVQVCK